MLTRTESAPPVHAATYCVATARGFLVQNRLRAAGLDRYWLTTNVRTATVYPDFGSADRAAKEALDELIARGRLTPDQQYFSIFLPALG